MTQDEYDRNMEFLLHWQAKFAAAHQVNLQEHAQFRAESERSRREFDDKHDKLYSELMALRDTAFALVDSTSQIAELMTRTFEAIDRRQDRTDHLLTRLEKVVFRHIDDPQAHGSPQA